MLRSVGAARRQARHSVDAGKRDASLVRHGHCHSTGVSMKSAMFVGPVGWQVSNDLVVPENVVLFRLPGYFPNSIRSGASGFISRSVTAAPEPCRVGSALSRGACSYFRRMRAGCPRSGLMVFPQDVSLLRCAYSFIVTDLALCRFFPAQRWLDHYQRLTKIFGNLQCEALAILRSASIRLMVRMLRNPI
jgi:hypothetical protein